MNQGSRDPLDELRHADPARSSRPPSESKARVWARIQEARMDPTPPRTPRRAAWAVALAGSALAVAAAWAALASVGGAAPSQQPGSGIGSCVETYSPTTLAERDFAFDGTVTAIEGERATFAVNERFKGELADSVTLRAAGMTGSSITSGGGLSLAIGNRYLVAGDDEFAWACGFTQPYDAAVAAAWAEATR